MSRRSISLFPSDSQIVKVLTKKLLGIKFTVLYLYDLGIYKWVDFCCYYLYFVNISTFFSKFTSTYCTCRCKWKHEKSSDIVTT